MGYDLHITRADHWTEANASPIASDEWHRLVAADPELTFSQDQFYERNASERGSERIDASIWAKGSEDVAFWFQDGEVVTKDPDDATILKAISIADALKCRVLGDDGEVYRRTNSPPGWEALAE